MCVCVCVNDVFYFIIVPLFDRVTCRMCLRAAVSIGAHHKIVVLTFAHVGSIEDKIL